MTIATHVLIGLVALEHIYFLVLEMFLWTKPKGLKTFAMTKEFAEQTKVLAANQGLYNGFLATGLIWSFFISDVSMASAIRNFFLICIIVAGLYGGYTFNKKIFYVQSIPALIALCFHFLREGL